MGYRIGLIGMIKEQLEADRWGCLERIAALGYQGLESATWLAGESEQEAKENRKRLNDLSLELVALPCSHDKEGELDEVIARAQLLGAGRIVDYWAAPEDDEELKALCEQLERMAGRCRSAGLQFMYHNHEHEFRPRFGEKGQASMFDELVANTEVLRFELDVAWCHFGGSDPVAVLRRVGQRVPVLHVKDLADDSVRGHFCAVGCGKVPCFAAIEAAAAKGCEWMVVEQDKPQHLSHYESAVASIYNIREAGLHPGM